MNKKKYEEEDYERYPYGKPIEIYNIPTRLKPIALMNGLRHYSLDDDSGYDTLNDYFVVVEKRGKYGVWDFQRKKKILPFIYDKVDPNATYIYLEKKGLATFYPNIGAKPKYKKLEHYIEYFARFETIDGKKGWVDRNGKEYYDK